MNIYYFLWQEAMIITGLQLILLVLTVYALLVFKVSPATQDKVERLAKSMAIHISALVARSTRQVFEMRNVNLDNVNLSNAKLEGLCFLGGSMMNVNLSKASLKNCVFNNVEMIAAKLYHTDITGTRFIQCVLIGAKLGNVWSAQDTLFHHCNITLMSIQGYITARSESTYTKGNKGGIRFVPVDQSTDTTPPAWSYQEQFLPA